MAAPEHPTWSNYITALMTTPYWIEPPAKREQVGGIWIEKMKEYNVDLSSYASVKEYAVTIYYHLTSRSMPLTDDQTQFWPQQALDAFRLWVNEGLRETDSDPIVPSDAIPIAPRPVEAPLRIRRDILTLTELELNIYRAKLDDVLRVKDLHSPWQYLCLVHSDWCLHYQEAFLPWHRVHVAYVESLIDLPIPYWNFFAADSATYGHPSSGIPQAFLDDTYTHPTTGEQRPNPLKYALAKDGLSKNGISPYPVRDPLLADPKAGTKDQRSDKVKMTELFLRQISDALAFPVFSHPQGAVGYPWANIAVFDPPQRDCDYPYRGVNFDGLFEQPHDNYHGWIGPDMADNAYTAFDPIFWSYHANVDRIFEIWRKAHLDAKYSSQFPLRPFVGNGRDIRIDMEEPRSWAFTSIGDVARDSKVLGYAFGEPKYPDYGYATTRIPHASSGTTNNLPLGVVPGADEEDAVPYIVFDKIGCTMDSFSIDVFLVPEGSTFSLTTSQDDTSSFTPNNPHYVGRMMRLGMGTSTNSDRCIRGRGITRVLNGQRCAQALGLKEGSDVKLVQLVRNVADGNIVDETEWKKWDGFEGEIVWGMPMGA
ncbi:tyrosinase [Collybia nuda]|uniref:tyrosinase n=1 Tax=Collybia nuda TaxID=64659 RepID=A0A9P5XZM4_9AGAR|nr:tyrosinase [Collybia nuda]